MTLFMQTLLSNSDLLLLGGCLLLILLAAINWQRQAVLMRMVQQANVQSREELARLEGQLRDQERQLLMLMSKAGQASQESAHSLERKMVQQLGMILQALERRFGELQKLISDDAGNLKRDLVERSDQLQQTVSHALSENRLAQQQGLSKGVEGITARLMEGLSLNAAELGKRVDMLTDSTDRRLKEIAGQVDRRLSEGFEKTTETFTRVLEHLSRIDEAQKRINELSSNVVSLQEVLTDKRSRGAFGEVQLSALVSNLMPQKSFSLQHTLSNGTRVDCMLHLPKPSGDIPIDAKFPLESYRRMLDMTLSESQRALSQAQFRQDIRKHIRDIADKYLIPNETAEGAVMFIPSESVFSEIHANFSELVDESHQQRVWLVSPTTMMAVLTTARALLKDAATREQVDQIQQHLYLLSKDFGRFQGRMDKLAVHIRQAHEDVSDVNISARKISKRFGQIERVELDQLEDQPPEKRVLERPVE